MVYNMVKCTAEASILLKPALMGIAKKKESHYQDFRCM
jgi:hypothetical protein